MAKVFCKQQKSRKPFQVAAFFAVTALSGDNRNLVWWSWGDLNPRPKLLHRRHYMLSLIFTFAG